MDPIKRKKWKRKKRLIIAYILRSSLVVLFLLMIFLVICGCVYLHDRISGKHQTVQANAYDALYNADNADEQNGIVVVLDAGHGGKDNGTAYDDILEKDINLAVVRKVEALLEENGVEVILTRDSDVFISLSGRVEISNEAEADLFISIHCNYYEKDSQIQGLECYYYEAGTVGKQYADAIFSSIEDRGIIAVRTAKEGDYYVLRNTAAPAVLVEIGYLSNTQERTNLTSDAYQEKLAQELTAGILAGLEEYAD